ncbi:hypothetical protein EG68_11068 [Paragonimus skrjabini miyazakii]|uniref:Uncharacterized protein n=1 Tax=Paragonimus skrjabini miyazakii TaxID=59628 RepID=A0A8S9YGR9_9TREM|nr:hypothetical protein EG68_11068 [Paragonimus skrjabini miyazakii]
MKASCKVTLLRGCFDDYARVLPLIPTDWKSAVNSMDESNIPGRNSQLLSENYGAYVPRVLRMTPLKSENNVSSNKLWKVPETRTHVVLSSLRLPRPFKKLQIGRALLNKSMGFLKETSNTERGRSRRYSTGHWLAHNHSIARSATGHSGCNRHPTKNPVVIIVHSMEKERTGVVITEVSPLPVLYPS